MTRAQVKNTMSMMKKQCIPKTGATEGSIFQFLTFGEVVEDMIDGG